MNRLADAGLEVFARDGLAAARMSDVAGTLGVSQGTLYNYVDSKEALFCLALDRATGADDIPLPDDLPITGTSLASIQSGLAADARELFRLERLDAALSGSPGESVADEARAIFEELHDRLAELRWAADIIERSAHEVPELFELFFLDLRRSVIERLARYLEVRSDEGRLGKGVDAEVTAHVILQAIDHAARGRHRDPAPLPADSQEYRATVVDLLVNGLLEDR